MKIYNKEIDFKISRLEDASRMELALQHMGVAEEQVKAREGDLLSDILRRQIKMFSDFFKDATQMDVLEGCTDLYEAKKAYFDFLKEIQKQKEAVITFSLDDIK